MSRPSLKLGLIGAGRIGRMHAEHLTTRVASADLVIVADMSVEAARSCAESYAIPEFTQDYRAVLAHPDIQAVVVCSSTDTHAQIIKEAAEAGKHIFCEKPVALDLASIDRALDAVRHAGVKLQIGFNRRFDANFGRVKQAIEQGEIGQLQQFHIVSRDPAPPPLEYIRVSGGLFLDMTIHDFDMVRFLTGCEIDEVSAIGDVMVDPAIGQAGDIDTAIVTLRMENGAIGIISNSRQAVYGYDQRVEVLGSEGMISIENNYPNTALISGRHCTRRDPPQYFFLERYRESFVLEMASFMDAVSGDTPVSVNGHDGRAPVVAALAAQKSLVENRPVRLREIT